MIVTGSNAGSSAEATSEATAVVAATSLTYVSQFGSEGSGDGQFGYPEGIATDSHVMCGVRYRSRRIESSTQKANI